MSASGLGVCLRPERSTDVEPIHHVNTVAFGRADEADLIDALRKAGAVTLSAVAVLGVEFPDGAAPAEHPEATLYEGEVCGGEVIGHVLFTPVSVGTEKGGVPLLGLGPVAVLPAEQHQGVGTLMIAGCLEYLRACGHKGVVVVGEPGFYRRFGFIEAARWGLGCNLQIPDENFLALPLRPGVLGGLSGVVSYRPEFDDL